MVVPLSEVLWPLPVALSLSESEVQQCSEEFFPSDPRRRGARNFGSLRVTVVTIQPS